MDSFSRAGDLLRFVLPEDPRPAGPAGEIGTGWSRLDEATGKWRRGELVLVQGDAATGKSALVYALALHAARQDHPVAMVPLKHAVDTAVQRMISALSGVPLTRLRRGAGTRDEQAAIASAADTLAGLPFHLHTAADPALERLLDDLQKLVVSRGIHLVVIDGLASIRVGALDAAGSSVDVRAAVALSALSTLVARLQIVGIVTSGPHAAAAGDMQAHRHLRIRTDRVGAVHAVELVPGGRDGAVTLPAQFDREHLRWRLGSPADPSTSASP